MRLLLATRNPKKLAELRRILGGDGRFEVVGLSDVDSYPETRETGATFAENALAKARDGVAHTGLPTVADDSGLAVDALNGMPGVLSARWSGAGGDAAARDAAARDAANLELVLAQVADVPEQRLGARFVCAAALALPDGRSFVAEGTMPGRLVRSPRGAGGFGYDPIFVADGFTRTNAELAPEEKDAISHRGKALRALAEIIARELPTAG
ncbi:MAG: RdgB/HAM1 family non-canonical purine NTP pyrophosphatase [Micromonosporaceae bacterium]|nr:RdgB/HAM1 family non-canonical purine NTP pyrophosphatase [Micromonosporaceae bacterium]